MNMLTRIFISSFIFSFSAQLSCGIFHTKCIDDLGCFYNGPPFFNFKSRLISLLPQDILNTSFLLFTPSNPDDPQILTPSNESLQTSTLNQSLDTKILIHGYNAQLREDDMMFAIKDELLKYYFYNVIVVNWTDSNGPPYPQATANARAVGAQVAKLINYHIENMGMDPATCHLIGHSLGGQLTGYAGERVPGLGRITGLDPAGPGFYKTAEEVRLDPTDAEFVDVIHTDGGRNRLQGLGTVETLGHMDFYPNGGKRQPGCLPLPVSICDHTRALNYFKESINTCQYPSVQCERYSDYFRKTCKSENMNTTQMGFHATKLDVPEGTRFYLLTSAVEPYCGIKY